jgi:hypothetical protein
MATTGAKSAHGAKRAVGTRYNRKDAELEGIANAQHGAEHLNTASYKRLDKASAAAKKGGKAYGKGGMYAGEDRD